MRFGTYNTLDLFMREHREERERRDRVYQVIRGLDCDVLAVQEIIAEDNQAAGRRLIEIADAVGMTCEIEPDTPAICPSAREYHVGLLWRPGLEVIPGSMRSYGPADMWHGLIRISINWNGQPVRCASHHGAPFGHHARTDQCERVVSALTRPPGPGLVGADWNLISADRRRDNPADFYDPDPYSGQPWIDDFVYQCCWRYDQEGRRRHWADRQAGDVLWSGGLRDAAAALDAPWQATTGHWADDPFPPRRIDAVRVTRNLVPAITSISTDTSELAASASDHRPVVVTCDPSLLAADA